MKALPSSNSPGMQSPSYTDSSEVDPRRHATRFNSQAEEYVKPSDPHTGQTSGRHGAHVLGSGGKKN